MNRSQEPTRIFKELVNYYLREKIIILDYIFKKGLATQAEIAELLEVSEGAISLMMSRHQDLLIKEAKNENS